MYQNKIIKKYFFCKYKSKKYYDYFCKNKPKNLEMMFCVIISKIYLFEFEFWAPKNISIYSEHLRYCLNWIPQRSREPSVLGWTRN